MERQAVEFADLFPTFNATAQETIRHLEKERPLTQDAVEKNAADLDNTVALLIERPNCDALKSKLDTLEVEKGALDKQLLDVADRLTAARDALRSADKNHQETIWGVGRVAPRRRPGEG